MEPPESTAPGTERNEYLVKIGTVCVLSVAAWFSFAMIFRFGFPMPSQPEDSLGVWWAWVAVGSAGFVVGMLGILRVLRIPRVWRTHAVLAFAAPALMFDMWTGTQTESWFPDAGPADDRLYLSFIVGGVGIIQFLTLLAEIPRNTTNQE